MFAVADEDYDEIEVDLPPSGGESRVAPYAIDIVQSEALSSEAVCIAQVGEIGGSSSKHRVLPRGERCGRCFRRRCIRLSFRVVNVAFTLLFLASAGLQYNDKAGVLWAAVYSIAAVFCILSELSWRQLRTYFVVPTLWLFTACVMVGAIYILFGRLLMRDPEGGASGAEANEFYGLVLVSFWMNVVLLLDRHNVVGVFRGYSTLNGEHERDKEGHVQMGEVVI